VAALTALTFGPVTSWPRNLRCLQGPKELTVKVQLNSRAIFLFSRHWSIENYVNWDFDWDCVACLSDRMQNAIRNFFRPSPGKLLLSMEIGWCEVGRLINHRMSAGGQFETDNLWGPRVKVIGHEYAKTENSYIFAQNIHTSSDLTTEINSLKSGLLFYS